MLSPMLQPISFFLDRQQRLGAGPVHFASEILFGHRYPASGGFTHKSGHCVASGECQSTKSLGDSWEMRLVLSAVPAREIVGRLGWRSR